MATKVRKKRRWQACHASIYQVMNRLQPFTRDEQALLNAPIRLAYEKLRTGIAVESDFHTLAAAINVTLVLSESVADAVVQTSVDARESMQRCLDRYRRTHTFGFDGPALQAIPECIELHEQYMALLTPLQITEAAIEVNRRMTQQIKELELKEQA